MGKQEGRERGEGELGGRGKSSRRVQSQMASDQKIKLHLSLSFPSTRLILLI